MTLKPHQANCNEVLTALILFIDNEISDAQEAKALEIHFEECPPCLKEMEHERQILATMKALLGNECREEAPQELHDRIKAQTALLAAQMGSAGQFVTEYRHTQTTTIYNDGVNEVTIEETHIEIETNNENGPQFPFF